MSKRRIIAFTTLFSVGIIVFLIGLTMVNFNIHSLVFMAKYTKVEKTFLNAENSKIVLDCEIDDIFIEQSQEDALNLTYFTSDKIKYTLTDKNGVITLHMLDRKWSDYFEVHLGEKFVKLSLPKNFNGEVEIYNKKGDISISGLSNCSKLFIRGEDSDIEIADIKIDNVSIENTGGDINIDKINSLSNSANYYFKTHSGDILISELNSNLNDKSALTLETTTGKVEFNKVNIYSVKVLSNEGNIKFSKLVGNVLDFKTGFSGIIVGEIDGDKEEYFIEVEGGVNNSIVGTDGNKEETTLTKFLSCKVFATIKIEFTKDSSIN